MISLSGVDVLGLPGFYSGIKGVWEGERGGVRYGEEVVAANKLSVGRGNIGLVVPSNKC